MIYFHSTEFNCPCCARNDTKQELYDKIDGIRQKLGIPLHINSGFRCEKHNHEVGGKIDSKHLVGEAIDVSIANMTNEKKHEFISLVHQNFLGVGIGKTFVHMDLRKTPAFWVYP